MGRVPDRVAHWAARSPTSGGLRLPLLIAGLAQCTVAIVLAGPLTRSLAASEQKEAAKAAAEALAGPSAQRSASRDRATVRSLAARSLEVDGCSRVPAGRRLHSRHGRGPLYWGRSSRDSRR